MTRDSTPVLDLRRWLAHAAFRAAVERAVAVPHRAVWNSPTVAAKRPGMQGSNPWNMK
jgi:hypothetical protein